MVRVGILGLQGDIARHQQALSNLPPDAIPEPNANTSPEAIAVRTAAELDAVDCLIIPGGESTTMSKILESNNLLFALGDKIRSGLPTWGTCAGMILLASSLLDGRSDQHTLGALDISVRRNAYGRQIDSFEAPLEIPAIGPQPFVGVFIRSPMVERSGPAVEVLARHNGHPVLCRQGHIWASSFHPELTDDTRLHKLFLEAAGGGDMSGKGG